MGAAEAGALMTEPVLTVEPSAEVAEVAAAMRAQAINSIVVIDEGCRPIGILTSTDFVGVVADGDADSTVGNHMTDGVITTSPAASVKEVARLMVDHDISHVPVVERARRY